MQRFPLATLALLLLAACASTVPEAPMELSSAAGLPALIPSAELTTTPGLLRSSLQIDAERPVRELVVAVELEHPDVSGLSLALVHPDGRRVTLLPAGQLQGDAFVDLRFVDGGEPIRARGAEPGLILAPAEPLAGFVGESARGAWMLEVSDARAPDPNEPPAVLWAWSLLAHFADGREQILSEGGEGEGDGDEDMTSFLACDNTIDVVGNYTQNQTICVHVVGTDRCPGQDSLLSVGAWNEDGEWDEVDQVDIPDQDRGSDDVQLLPGQRVKLYCNGNNPGRCGYSWTLIPCDP